MRFNESATYLKREYWAPMESEAVSGGAAQDITSRLEGILSSDDTGESETNVNVALEDGANENLPEDGDAEAEEEDNSDDSEEAEDISDEELSLAGYLGIDEERLIVKDDGSVVFNAIIDGKSQEVDLKELAKSYQLQGHVNNKSMALEAQRVEFEKTRDAAYADLTKRLDGVEQLHKISEDALLSEYNSIDWNQLRVNDPSEWAALKQEFSERASYIQQAKELAGQERARIDAERANELKANRDKHLNHQFNLMVQDNPSWANQEVMAKEVGEIGSFLKETYNFTDHDLTAVTDHRLVRLIKDAKAYRNGKKGITEKKVAPNLPKFQKPGSKASDIARTAKARQVKAQKQAIRTSGGHVDAIAQSIVDRM